MDVIGYVGSEIKFLFKFNTILPNTYDVNYNRMTV